MVDDDDMDVVSAFEWRVKVNPCGTKYVRARLAGGDGTRTTVWLHRFLMDAKEGFEVHHGDGNGLNCTRGNLKVVTPLQNRRAHRWKNPKCSSRYRGVCWDKRTGRWIAAIRRRIGPKKKQFHLGRFDSEHAAASAWNVAALDFGFLPDALNKISAAA